ncbi:hypothetical protein LCGC14_3099640, partial [marine sediment metagenome]
CRAGVAAFAEAVREQNPILAEDLQAKLQYLTPASPESKPLDGGVPQ